MAKKCPECRKGTPLWMVSWADMVTLLMCFFIVIVAFSSTQAAKFKEMAGSMKDAFGVAQSSTISPVISGPNIVGTAFQQQVVLLHMMEKFRIAMSRQIDNGDAEILEVEQGFLMVFKGEKIINVYGELANSAKATLEHVATIIAPMPNMVHIRTFWSESPILVDGKKASAWMSAAFKNAKVVEYLVDKTGIDPNRLLGMTMQDNPENKSMEGKIKGEDRLEILISRETPGIYGEGGENEGR
ncbi:MAG: hypothetical protein G8345_19210 [Magnetococcales bacterium]|nr:hypothetical protein [Magnetococcales bacterium]NGZ29005.1 hypothetical protein [Magnetococcales bacterium]